MSRRLVLEALGILAVWALVVAAAALYAGRAEAMTVADVPAVSPNAVEVCDSYHQTVCPLVTLPAALNVSAPSRIDGMPAVEGTIVRFEPINSDQGAWVRLARTGGQLWYPLRDLTLLGAR